MTVLYQTELKGVYVFAMFAVTALVAATTAFLYSGSVKPSAVLSHRV